MSRPDYLEHALRDCGRVELLSISRDRDRWFQGV